jgi:hypothetical protein
VLTHRQNNVCVLPNYQEWEVAGKHLSLKHYLVQNQETSLGKGCRGIPCRSARCPRIFFSFPKSFGENALGKCHCMTGVGVKGIRFDEKKMLWRN